MARRHNNEITDISSPGGDSMSIDSQQPCSESSSMGNPNPIGAVDESGEVPASFTDWVPTSPFVATANAAPDSFKMEYYSKASHATEYESFSTYRRQSFQPSLSDDAPWAPFLSRVDFEIAEVTHQSTMSKGQINQLLKLIWSIAGGQLGFTLRSYNDITNAWSHVIPQLTPVHIT
ncbi:hypothetical protein J3R82DRAFT_1663 [Butyriboletus roseoflavus]|nr:hypothetical protein J3R82DRAFT_1663 [Butyriboletus roseoflavus]